MISPNQLAETVIKTITSRKTRSLRIVNINSKDLSAKGDLSFRLGLDQWRGYVDTESDWFQNSKNILHFFMQRCFISQYSTLNDDQIDSKLLEIFKKCVSKIGNTLSFLFIYFFFYIAIPLYLQNQYNTCYNKFKVL
jgi:hypothetical protein